MPELSYEEPGDGRKDEERRSDHEAVRLNEGGGVSNQPELDEFEAGRRFGRGDLKSW